MRFGTRREVRHVRHVIFMVEESRDLPVQQVGNFMTACHEAPSLHVSAVTRSRGCGEQVFAAWLVDYTVPRRSIRPKSEYDRLSPMM
jgi:hypothetical protein